MTSPALLGEYDCLSKNGTANVGEGVGSRGGGRGGWQITQTDCKPEVKKKGVVVFGLIGIRIKMDRNAYPVLYQAYFELRLGLFVKVQWAHKV